MQSCSKFVALSLGVFFARTAVPVETIASESMMAASGCPGAQAHVVLRDYDGDVAVTACVAPNGLIISGGVVSLTVYDPTMNGLFRSGFEQTP